MHAKVVSVAGEVHGNLFAGEQILIRRSATMLGNLTAPRVGLEDGCCFRGSVDMETPDKGRRRFPSDLSAPRARAAPAKPVESTATERPANAGSGATVKPETPPVRP